MIKYAAGPIMDARRLARALDNLTRRIQNGEEFPDACWASASRYNVRYEALQAEYDSLCEVNRGEA